MRDYGFAETREINRKLVASYLRKLYQRSFQIGIKLHVRCISMWLPFLWRLASLGLVAPLLDVIEMWQLC